MVREVFDVMIGLAKQSGLTMICVTKDMNFASNTANRVVSWIKVKTSRRTIPRGFFTRPHYNRIKVFLEQLLR